MLVEPGGEFDRQAGRNAEPEGYRAVKLLVTGGAGYIGSVTSRLLLDAGHELVVLDNLSTGVRGNVAQDATVVQADVRNAGSVLSPDSAFDAVLHFAGLIAAGESMVK